jgi:hypothetical protein
MPERQLKLSRCNTFHRRTPFDSEGFAVTSVLFALASSLSPWHGPPLWSNHPAKPRRRHYTVYSISENPARGGMVPSSLRRLLVNEARRYLRANGLSDWAGWG